ncbi:hypothetical protein DL96DRAFT_1814801 [Flagelloscypha sp. PMI_526]|nr:hypothetical protein DL96DRAFT_1814801 [Flagelloscypha sp. PMI_526]
MSTVSILKRFLPLLIFPSLTYFGLSTIFTHLRDSTYQLKVGLQCPKDGLGLTPYRIAYTGNDGFDKFLCGIILFFHRSMEPEGAEFLYYMLGAGAFCFLLPPIESTRKSTGYFNILVSFPVITLLLCQVATLGGMMPVWWTFFLVGGHHKLAKNQAVITRAHAESLLFGALIGLAIPTVAMLTMKDPIITAIWQPCPLWFYIAQQAHLRLFHTRASYPQSGYHIMKWLYIGLFITASSFHVAVVAKRWNDLDALKTFFIPPVTPDRQALMSVQSTNVLQWDLAIALSSCILASFWFTSNLAEFAKLFIWYLVAVPLAGPCASVIGVLLWRESKLNDTRGAFGVQSKAGQKKGKKE